MQLLQGVGCQGGGGLPSVHLHGTLTLGLLGPESRLYRGGTPRRSLDWLGLESRPHEGGTPRRSLGRLEFPLEPVSRIRTILPTQ